MRLKVNCLLHHYLFTAMEKFLGKLLNFIDGKRYYPVLAGFLVVDCIFILIHLLHWQGIAFGERQFNLTLDESYAEVFQYFKFVLIVLGMSLLALRNRSLIYLSWAVIFTILLFDDSLALHERGGQKLSLLLNFQPLLGLRPTDLGEILVYFSYGLLLVFLAAISYRRDRDRFARAASVRILIFLAALVVVSGLVDMLHMMAENLIGLPRNSIQYVMFDILEDGGELVVVSLITWFTYVVFKQQSFMPQAERATIRIPTSSLQD